ncbi:hypothetical protein [Turicibacter sanguinis]|uniref:hypothetical protein n=1 Tax=Turicibacter sanguinis TaxID=154288 RepID=UPI00232A905D|nr:hypothetical protein [Turicibacter sanguinis]MDB8575611.1 hypothetical protein [Turicibacter sanguinis]MDB8578753.1 hypothetical protein [Turicibacter sanguinis]MDB8584076.1 hypothetical protein [Turicibacter sanguinis]MDB8588011.1 hypothetical protein [Turicibacter sanguinis]MDB8598143.1 hypothetical protein [Turicibacter sanguinis]
MNIITEVHLEIKSGGIVQILKEEKLLKDDGTEIVLDYWRRAVAPGNYDELLELELSEYHLNIINAVWTREVVEAYQRKQKEKEAKQTTELSGF